MAPHDQRKARNNARKAAARALQRQHPEMSYQQALTQVARLTASAAEASDPLHILSLLNIASAEDIAARQRADVLDLAVSVGIGDTDDAITLNIDHRHSEGGQGPHGAILGPGALNFALALAAALRTNNGVDRAQVAFVGTKDHCRTAVPAVDHVVATPWQDFIRANLSRRARDAEAAQVRNLAERPDIANRMVVLVDVDDTLTADEATSLTEAVRLGRSLGVHVIVVGPDDSSLTALPRVTSNLAFIVRLGSEGGRKSATLDLTDDEHFAFSPATFRESELTRWLSAARQVS